MITKTRLKFFAVTSAIAVTMIVLFCGLILGSKRMRDIADAKSVLERVVAGYENRMTIDESQLNEPPDTNPDDSDAHTDDRIPFNDYRTFIVVVDQNGKIDENQPSISSYFTAEEIENYVAKIFNGESFSGFLIFKKNTGDGHKIIAAIDISIENEAFNKLFLIVSLIGGCGAMVMLVLIWFLSYWMVKPAEQSLEKQKRFISEASHELKTPLTVISAGLELLQKEKGLSSEAKKWIGDIKMQTKKMTRMTTDLLSLSKIEEGQGRKEADFFNISAVVMTNALAFESVAFEQNKELIFDIQENLTYRGNIKAVNKAIEILCDNAIKHSDDKSKIIISLKKQSYKTVLTVTNKGSSIKEDDLPFLFERFYRGSESRAAVPGTGLGLAILKTMTEQNGWKIDVKLAENNISFIITF